MVMIPVGNRTRHCFRLWFIVEMYIRIIISAVVLNRAEHNLFISNNAYFFLYILFFMWSFRPVYLEFKSLYDSWVWAKHEKQSDALKGETENE